MGGIKTRGKDKQKRKKRSQSLKDAIKNIASKLKKKPVQSNWSFDFGEKDDKPKPPESLPGRHVFKSIEINLRDLIK